MTSPGLRPVRGQRTVKIPVGIFPDEAGLHGRREVLLKRLARGGTALVPDNASYRNALPPVGPMRRD